MNLLNYCRSSSTSSLVIHQCPKILSVSLSLCAFSQASVTTPSYLCSMLCDSPREKCNGKSEGQTLNAKHTPNIHDASSMLFKRTRMTNKQKRKKKGKKKGKWVDKSENIILFKVLFSSKPNPCNKDRGSTMYDVRLICP